MLHKTPGIALSYIKYRETSIIAKIFTEAFGIQSYIVNGVRSNKAKTSIALFQPLSVLDLVVYHNKKKSIHRISEIRSRYSLQTIPFDIGKTSIALFLTELLNQVLHEEHENIALFSFIENSIKMLDGMAGRYGNFHLQFMLSLADHLGIRPLSAREMMKEVGHVKIYDPSFGRKLTALMNSGYQEHIRLDKETRNEMLLLIIDYLRYHYDSIKEFKSIPVLKEVLN